MASYRHLARIVVMQTLFAYEFRDGVDAEATLVYCRDEFGEKINPEFAEELLRGVLSKLPEIYKILQTEAPEWPVERIAPIDCAILAIGIYEIVYSSDVPPVVAINEGVETAKTYGDINSPKFVNGVLSAVMHKYKNESVKDVTTENET
jgi:transcription antitermination protein NusB